MKKSVLLEKYCSWSNRDIFKPRELKKERAIMALERFGGAISRSFAGFTEWRTLAGTLVMVKGKIWKQLENFKIYSFCDIQLKIYSLPNFNTISQFLLTSFPKSELFLCLRKVDHVTNYCKKPITMYPVFHFWYIHHCSNCWS